MYSVWIFHWKKFLIEDLCGMVMSSERRRSTCEWTFVGRHKLRRIDLGAKRPVTGSSTRDNLACEQALLFGRVKRVSRERARGTFFTFCGVSGVEMKIYERSLQALLSSAPRSRVLARLATLAQIGELARRLVTILTIVSPSVFWPIIWTKVIRGIPEVSEFSFSADKNWAAQKVKIAVFLSFRNLEGKLWSLNCWFACVNNEICSQCLRSSDRNICIFLFRTSSVDFEVLNIIMQPFKT